MANIRVDLDYELTNGINITFKAPCDCSEITGLIIYYPKDGKIINKIFSFRDAHNNDLSSLDNLFTSGACVKVILDTINRYAFIQNADTNSYLENKIKFLEGGNWETLGSLTYNSGEIVHDVTNWKSEYNDPFGESIIIPTDAENLINFSAFRYIIKKGLTITRTMKNIYDPSNEKMGCFGGISIANPSGSLLNESSSTIILALNEENNFKYISPNDIILRVSDNVANNSYGNTDLYYIGNSGVGDGHIAGEGHYYYYSTSNLLPNLTISSMARLNNSSNTRRNVTASISFTIELQGKR